MDTEQIKTEQKEDAVQSLKVPSLVLKISADKAVRLDQCPFCFSVYWFPKEVINTKKHACSCGARFTSLGHATKYVKSEESKS
jgi:hypothetical protein